jgi:hypothetical protein
MLDNRRSRCWIGRRILVDVKDLDSLIDSKKRQELQRNRREV